MVHFVSAALTCLLFLSSTAHATNWAPAKFAIASVDNGGATVYFYSGGTIQELGTHGVPSNPSGYDSWFVDFNFASPPTGITNVAPSSDFAALGYINAIGGLIIRVFYQTTNGDIRSVWHDVFWMLDQTTIANVPLGTPISAFAQLDPSGNLGVLVHYTDANGLLTQRFSTTDAGNWSAPITIST